MSAINRTPRGLAHSATVRRTALLAALIFLGRSGHCAGPVQSKEHLGAVSVAQPGAASAPRNLFEISSCSGSGTSEPYSYSASLREALNALKEARRLKSEIETSGMPPEQTINKYQHTKRDHYDVVEMDEKKQGSDSMVVRLLVWSYWKDSGPEDHPHKQVTDITLEPCNFGRRTWDACREIQVEQIRDQLVGLDKTHK